MSKRSWWLVERLPCGVNMWMPPIWPHACGMTRRTFQIKMNHCTVVDLYDFVCLFVWLWRPRACAAAERLWSNEEKTLNADLAFPRLVEFRCQLVRYWKYVCNYSLSTSGLFWAHFTYKTKYLVFYIFILFWTCDTFSGFFDEYEMK